MLQKFVILVISEFPFFTKANNGDTQLYSLLQTWQVFMDYIGNKIIYTAETVNFIVDLWREFTNGEMFPINETEFPRFDEFVAYLKTTHHYDALQGRHHFLNMDGRSYFWEVILTPSHLVQTATDEEIYTQGKNLLFAPVDAGPGFDGFLYSVLYHMMNKTWISEEVTVPGSGLELSTEYNLTMRLLKNDAINNSCGNAYCFIDAKNPPLAKVHRQVLTAKRKDVNCYVLKLFEAKNGAKHCGGRVLKAMGIDKDRLFDNYADIKTALQAGCKTINYSIYELEKNENGICNIVNRFENISGKDFKVIYCLFVIKENGGQHVMMTMFHAKNGEGCGKRGHEYLYEHCEKCDEYVADLLFHQADCFVEGEGDYIIADELPANPYTIDDIINMESKSNEKIEECINYFSEGQSIYVNGPGGSGKSDMIKRMQDEFVNLQVLGTTAEVSKRYPGGQTVHSFFKIGAFTKLVKGNVYKEYKGNFQKLEKWVAKNFKDVFPDYFIIDESSMLLGSIVYYIDIICKFKTENHLKDFGGIPFAFVLDETQLPPVTKDTNDVYVFATSPVNCIRLKRSVTFDSPWRLAKGVQDKQELLAQHNYLSQIRFGNDCVGNQFFSFIGKNQLDYKSLNGVILVRTNAIARDVVRKVFPDKVFVKPWADNVFEGFIGMKVICTSNISKIKTNDNFKPHNGLRGQIVCIEKEKVVVDFDGHQVSFLNYKDDTGAPKIDLVNARVITIHRSQGLTVEGKIYIEWFASKQYFQRGQLYVALSRCTNLRNVTIIKDGRYDEEKFLPMCLKFDEAAVSVAKNPRRMLPEDLMNVGSGYAVNSKKRNSEVFLIKDKRFQKTPKHIKIKETQILKDCHFEEYPKIFDNALIIDHETGYTYENGVKVQRVICTFIKYYVDGKPTHFNQLLGYHHCIYDWDDEFKMMEFSIDYCDDPMEEICKGICAILETARKYREEGKKCVGEWEYIMKYPMTDWGFNNNGFDVHFFLKEYMKKSNWNFQIETIRAATSFKGFSLKDGHRTIYQTRDLMLLCGPGGLEKTSDSWCKNLNDILLEKDERKFYEYINPIISQMPMIKEIAKHSLVPGKVFDYDIPNSIISNIIRRGQKEFENLKQLSKNLQVYAIDGKIGKGHVPLKLATELSQNVSTWRNLDNVIDLTTFGGEDGFVNHCYFPREHDSVVKRMAQDGNAEYFKNYQFKREFKLYARLDTLITELLMRSLNDAVYKFGWRKDITPLPSSDLDPFIKGTRTSLLNYSTTANLVQQIAFTNLPECCIRSTKDGYIETNIYCLPKKYDNLVNGILGGKTLARRMHFQSQGEDDYMQYLDFSGMYMKILEENEYPYGPFRMLSKEKCPREIGILEKQYEEGVDDIFNNCGLYKVVVSSNPLEIEPVFGLKRKGQAIDYRIGMNNEQATFVTNYELQVFKDYGVKLHCIKECVIWKSQTNMFETSMKFYADLKNSAEANGDKVGRTFAKLMANSTFGTMAKSDKPVKTVIWSSLNELLEIFKQYPSCGGFMRNVINRGKFYAGEIHVQDGLNSTTPYIGRFTLGASKRMLYDAIRIGYGNRFSKESFKNMLAYGDTDSITLHRSCIENLKRFDDKQSEENQKLFYPGGNVLLKAGKLTDELLDDLDKYFKDGEYVKAVKGVNQNWNDVANPRIVEIFNPAAKSGGVKFKIPAFEYEGIKYDEKYGYKVFCKGISSSASIWVDHPDAPDKVYGMGHNQETYELFRFAYAHLLPLKSRRQNVLKKILFTNSTEEGVGLNFGDVISIDCETDRMNWGTSIVNDIVGLQVHYEGEEVGKKRKHDQLLKNDIISKNHRHVLEPKEIRKLVASGKTMFEISSGQKIFPGGQIDHLTTCDEYLKSE